MKVTYVTLVSSNDWAVVNSFWAIQHHTGAIPTNIHVIYKTNDRERAERGMGGMREILSKKEIQANIEMHEIEDIYDIMEGGRKVEEICKDHEDIILDITPARKAMASGAVISGIKNDIDRVFYLYIDSVEGGDRPYLDIPLPRQDLVEMIRNEHHVKD